MGLCPGAPIRENLHREIIIFLYISNEHGEGNGTALQYSCLANPMNGGAWKAAVRGVARSRTRLSDFTFTFHFHALEKGMATHSSVLAWKIPGTGEPGGLPSMGSHRVGQDLAAAAAAAAATMNNLKMKTVSFITASKRIKCLGINLTNVRLYIENYKLH